MFFSLERTTLEAGALTVEALAACALGEAGAGLGFAACALVAFGEMGKGVGEAASFLGGLGMTLMESRSRPG